MAGRPRKPTKLHLLQGTGKVHPERMRERENEPEPNKGFNSKPPKTLDPEETKVWKEFVGKIPKGVVGDCDEFVVEQAVRLLTWLRKNATDAPKWTTYCQRFEIQLGKLGMTPADRSKVIGGE